MHCTTSGSEWADEEMETARVDYCERSDEKERRVSGYVIYRFVFNCGIQRCLWYGKNQSENDTGEWGEIAGAKLEEERLISHGEPLSP